ncbi:SpoIID/LytB domain-containing protein [Knoellia sp. S7-12]|uniref:SpoIID/LytB domain-containing protein n=1 Tax=Knoellia sp. S7-12 TaxID=3126698 RepID=UPI003367E909
MKILTTLATAAILLAAPVTTAAALPSAFAAPAPQAVPAAPTVAAAPLSSTWPAPIASGRRSTTGVAKPVIGLRGRGFGHGRGMSQWGARGAAQQGRTVDQILAFYYPGTTSASIGNPDVRVRLTAMSYNPTVVAGEAGLTLTDGTCTAQLSPANATSWRISRSGGWKVEGYFTSSSGFTGWWPVTTTCSGFATAQHLTFVGDGSIANSVLTLRTPSGNRQYRGGLRATPVTLRGSIVVHTYGTVNVLSMNSYLRSVVPAEMPASWGLEAVKAQAVAARSYAAARLGSPDGFDICDTTSCQVYPGLTSANPEHPNSDAAVAGTTGLVRKYGTAIANTEFSSTNGGQIAGSTLAYQVAKADPYDGVYEEAPDTWSYLTMPVSALEKAWPAIGTFRSMTIGRNGQGAWFGGRATSITLIGTNGTHVVGGESFRSRLNLRSTWFIPVGSSVGTDFAGNGFSDLIARDTSGNLWNYPSNGRGGWLPRTSIATGWPAVPEILAPGDFSGDGIPDLLSRSTATGALTLHRGSGTGTIAWSAVVGSGWQSFTAVVAPGDLDGDGAVDLLARDSAGVLWLYPGTGKGALKPRVSKGSGWGSFLELEAVGDFDGDGGTDLMAKNAAGTLSLLRFSAAGAYLGGKAIGSGFQSYTSFTGLGDVDGNGAVDLVARDGAGALWAFRGTGTGVLGTRLALGSGWSGLTMGS